VWQELKPLAPFVNEESTRKFPPILAGDQVRGARHNDRPCMIFLWLVACPVEGLVADCTPSLWLCGR
jgi:hypothetical protein